MGREGRYSQLRTRAADQPPADCPHACKGQRHRAALMHVEQASGLGNLQGPLELIIVLNPCALRGVANPPPWQRLVLGVLVESAGEPHGQAVVHVCHRGPSAYAARSLLLCFRIFRRARLGRGRNGSGEQTGPTLRILPQPRRVAQEGLQGFVGRRHPLLVGVLLFHVRGQDLAVRFAFDEHSGPPMPACSGHPKPTSSDNLQAGPTPPVTPSRNRAVETRARARALPTE